jgi:hypothetical protein
MKCLTDGAPISDRGVNDVIPLTPFKKRVVQLRAGRHAMNIARNLLRAAEVVVIYVGPRNRKLQSKITRKVQLQQANYHDNRLF